VLPGAAASHKTSAPPATTAARPRPILWDIYEEHLDEAAFLWREWETALDAAIYTLSEVAAGPEERLRAHLDGLVLGGKPVAEKLLLPALTGDDDDLVRPAAWALLAAEDADHFDHVLEALATAEIPKARAVARALGLSRHPATVPRLAPLWTNGSPRLRAILLDVIGRHDLAWVAPRVVEALRPGDPLLLGAALRLVRYLPDRDPAFIWYAEDGLTSVNAGVRGEALATAFVLGSTKVFRACRAEIDQGSAGRLVFGLLALSADPADRELLRKSVRARWSTRHAVWALGFAGDVQSADELVGLMEQPKLAPLAAEAFTAITGLAIEGRYRTVGVTRGPADKEVGLDDPPPVVRPEDHLPAPAAEAIGDWWRQNRGRFAEGQRYARGATRVPETLRGALAVLPTWRREVTALELAAATGGAVGVRGTRWARE
jgi:uncharacterized protein (TIGR02270 family)